MQGMPEGEVVVGGAGREGGWSMLGRQGSCSKRFYISLTGRQCKRNTQHTHMTDRDRERDSKSERERERETASAANSCRSSHECWQHWTIKFNCIPNLYNYAPALNILILILMYVHIFNLRRTIKMPTDRQGTSSSISLFLSLSLYLLLLLACLCHCLFWLCQHIAAGKVTQTDTSKVLCLQNCTQLHLSKLSIVARGRDTIVMQFTLHFQYFIGLCYTLK